MRYEFTPGNHKPKFEWDQFLSSFKPCKGSFILPIDMWYRANDNYWHRAIGRKDLLSGNKAEIRIYPDSIHVGRFVFAGYTKYGKVEKAVPLGVGYNDRQYSYKIEKRRRGWLITIDSKNVLMEVKRTPWFSTQHGPLLNKNKTYSKSFDIRLEDYAFGIQAGHIQL